MPALASDLISDLLYALRMLRKTPVTTFAAVLTLALGLGGTTAMFSVVDGVLLRPLPYPRADRLVTISGTSSQGLGSISPGDFFDLRRDARSFDALTAVLNSSMSLTGDGAPEQVRVQSVSGGFFAMFGAEAVAGRLFTPTDDEQGPYDRIVVSERLWRDRYGSRRDVDRLHAVLGGLPVDVVGVAPARFKFDRPADVWFLGHRGVPRGGAVGADLTTNRDVHVLQVIGTLADGVSMPVAQAELDADADRFARAFPQTNTGAGFAIEPLAATIVGDTGRVLVVLLGAVIALLLIASVNVANLMLVRTSHRDVELTMRSALGAAPSRVLRLILTEAVVLALVGGALGLVLAMWGVQLLTSLAPPNLPRLDEVVLDARVLGAGLVVTLLTGCAFGLWPAWRASRAALAPVLAGSGRATSGRDRRRGQYFLVGGQLALAEILLVGAGLLIASFGRLMAVDPGLTVRDRHTVDMSLAPAKYRKDSPRKIAFHEAALREIGGIPGVRRVAMAMTSPLSGAINRGVWIEGQPAPQPGQRQTMSFVEVSESYFDLLGIPILKGRGLSASDGPASEPVVVVNEAFVRRYFGDGDALAHRIGFGDRSLPGYWRRVVGVVADARERLADAPQPTSYLSFRQDSEPWNGASYVVETTLPVETVATSMRQAILRVDPDQPISRVRSLDESIAGAVAVERFAALLSGVLAALALGLAAIGAFGVMSHVVGSRRRELGVRLAVGAQPRDIVRLVSGECLRVVLGASVVGLAGAAIAARFIATRLFGVGPGDPATFAIALTILAATGLVATYVPVRRALAGNPIASLRSS